MKSSGAPLLKHLRFTPADIEEEMYSRGRRAPPLAEKMPFTSLHLLNSQIFTPLYTASHFLAFIRHIFRHTRGHLRVSR